MFIDTHTHLLDPRFDKDRKETIERAVAAGIAHIIETGWGPDIWEKTLEFAQSSEKVWCVLGLHPQDARKMDARQYDELDLMLSEKKVVGIGETGLDYHYMNSPKEKQKEVFLMHVELSRKHAKPLVIHCRDAYADLIEILEKHRLPGGGVIHCFSGSRGDAEKLIELGCYIGVDGPVTYPNASALKDSVKNIPLDRILLETDCPYLPPQDFRGKRNEPSYIVKIAEAVAGLKCTDAAKIAEATSINAKLLFSMI
ncbi:MAG: TatD family hydrolase [Endomicrobiales bacterium]|nr:TatD family hydrolase [Endomicrobiales bacterium]